MALDLTVFVEVLSSETGKWELLPAPDHRNSYRCRARNGSRKGFDADRIFAGEPAEWLRSWFDDRGGAGVSHLWALAEMRSVVGPSVNRNDFSPEVLEDLDEDSRLVTCLSLDQIREALCLLREVSGRGFEDVDELLREIREHVRSDPDAARVIFYFSG